jgi:uncharacterized protein YjbJ (UPF0337 family)
MNKDRVEGKVKDVAGRVERQAEGKVQNAWGKAKDATKKTADDAKASSKPPQRVPDAADAETSASKEARRRG